jgi:poly-gamma-glutamate capsule biosynthesis protein CapA/YwtB (metallophosphatase superfamily)
MRRFLVAVLLLPCLARAEEVPITIAAVGDIMLGSTYPKEDGSALAPDDAVSLLQDATPLLTRADIAFGNLEGPLIDAGESRKCRRHKRGCFAFRMPTRYGALLKAAGFDVLSLANNHAFDFGQEGRTSTQATLDAQGIAHSGAVGDIAHLKVRGRDVDFIAFTTAGHSYNLNDLKRAVKVVRKLARKDLVVVSFHGGAEGNRVQHVPQGVETFHRRSRGDLRAFAHAMIEAGAAAVIGHGPHVLRAMEIYQGHFIAYSLGNFATYKGMGLSGATRTTGILELALNPDGAFVSATVHPMKQPGRGGPRPDKRRKALTRIEELSEEDFPETGVIVARDGSITARPPPPLAGKN